MQDDKIRHLEMIEAVIARMAQNSFAYKGWAITLVAAILAIAASQGMDYRYVSVGLLPAVAFWGLDGYYLRQERLFRRVYDATRRASLSDWEKDPFGMDTSPHTGKVGGWLKVCGSKSVAGLYLPLVAIVVVASLLRSCLPASP